MTVALSVEAPGRVRRSLERHYVDSIERSLLDDITVMASELVTNAVQHSGRPDGDPIEVTAQESGGVFRVVVTDGGVGMDRMVARSSDPPSGLRLVQLLSDRWASSQTHSFEVWFEIDVTRRALKLARTPQFSA